MVTTNDSKPVDQRIDSVFGEPVVFKPMKTQQGGYRALVPDPDRLEVIAVGIYDDGRGNVEGTVGTHRQATVDTFLSIRFEPILQCDLKKGDRIFFPDRQEVHEVVFIHPEATGRWMVHMVRVLEDMPAPTRQP